MWALQIINIMTELLNTEMTVEAREKDGGESYLTENFKLQTAGEWKC
jgi:hypothetical protein